MDPVPDTAVLDGVRLPGRPGRWRLSLANGRIRQIERSTAEGGGLVLPLLADIHVHLDKTLTCDRFHTRPASLADAIAMTAADRERWTDTDIRDRAARALTRAHANGIAIMRSHVDWTVLAPPIAWSVLAELRDAWVGRMTLELASLSPLDLLAETGEPIARAVARTNGVLGCFVHQNGDLSRKIARVFDLAEARDLSLDFHVDECLERDMAGFDGIVAETARREMTGRVLVGHACSLSVRPESEVSDLLEQAGEAGIAMTILPTTNAFLQDASPGRTPRLRGLAPMHEARSAGVPVFIASDNVRDGFYPHGDYDLLDVYRFAVLTGHLDAEDWIDSIAESPAAWCGARPALVENGPADFIWVDADGMDDLISRPRAARQVWRDGRPLPSATGSERP
ncbi:MAG: amidohydrolase family protein [Paracoccaceae bacterium]|nr:amidohydrolase family protein [Paracoccaceae bacterium]